ncbi:alpha/beta fold hydrolase [Luteolibacter sp. Populi]|uniref:alpha/beta fold hydrolase n=1 Tax=Luteolibacter sp. Populi TaxID=3230487 RepID=UPI003466FDAF
MEDPTQPVTAHRYLDMEGMRIFYREAGPAGAPVLLLPHGYPCSSYQYRWLIPALADRWRVIAPDFPGFGQSDTPTLDEFGYDFDAYAAFLDRFANRLQLDRFTLYLHDYGSQIGFRLAILAPERIAGLVIQNGDIYEDALGPKYKTIQEYWANPTLENRKMLEDAVNEEGFRHEFIGEIPADQIERIPPDLWKLHWPLMNNPVRREVAVRLMEGLKENLSWFPRYQAYLREHQPPALIVWGPNDGYMPEPAARAYLRDLPNAEFHLLSGGHWLLETHFEEALALIRSFLEGLEVTQPSTL